MKILIVLPTLAGGGAEMVAATLSREFHKSGHVPLFALFKDEVNYQYAGEKFILDSPDNHHAGGRLRAHMRRHYKLKKLVKKQSPDVILSFLEAPNLHNVLVNRRAVVSVRNSRSATARPPFTWKWLEKLVYRSATRVITVSEEIKHNIMHTHGISEDHLLMLPNPLDIDWIREQGNQPLDEEWRDCFSRPVIVNVGSLTRQKAQHLLILAFASLLKRKLEMNLLILGDGPLRDELQTLVDSLHISKHVFIPGRVSNPFKYVKKSRVMVLPSYFEGWPNALVEALALQVPVVATDCFSGPREILKQGKSIDEDCHGLEKTKCGVLIPAWRENGRGKSETLRFLEDAVIDVTSRDEKSWLPEDFDDLIDGLQAEKIARRYLAVLESAIA